VRPCFVLWMRRAARAAFVASLFLACVTTLAAAPGETSGWGSSERQQRPPRNGQTDTPFKGSSTTGDHTTETPNTASPGGRRRVLQTPNAPTATPRPVRTLREDADVTRGVVISLEGSLHESVDASTSTNRDRLRAVITSPILCGDTGVTTCGKLFQVTPDGEQGVELEVDSCDADSDWENACGVADPLGRVLFFPDIGGKDLYGQSDAASNAYASVVYAVVDTVTKGKSPSVIVAVRVNAKPVVPSPSRRVFVPSDFSGLLPLSFLATDSDSDEITIRTVGFLPARYQTTLGTRAAMSSLNDPRIVTPAEEWFSVTESDTKGTGLQSDGTSKALPEGSVKIWFAPTGVGDSDTCCPSRTCGGAYVPATCQPCYDDATTDPTLVKPDDDCSCCPARHFYGRLLYVAVDARGSTSNEIGHIDVYVTPGSRNPEVPPGLGLGAGSLGLGSGYSQTLGLGEWAPPKIFANEGATVYFRLPARNFGEKVCVEFVGDGDEPPRVACVSESMRAVVMNPPISGGGGNETKGQLSALVFTSADLETSVTEIFGDAGAAYAELVTFDADDVSAFSTSQSNTSLGNANESTSFGNSVAQPALYGTYESPQSELHRIVAECVRRGVASTTPLLGAGDASANEWPAIPQGWRDEMSSDDAGYDVGIAKLVPTGSLLLLAYTPPSTSAGFPFLSLKYGVVDEAGLASRTLSTADIFVRHALNANASRFTRFPFWGFRPILPGDDWFGAKAEHTVDWWNVSRTVVGGLHNLPDVAGSIPGELRTTNFLVPKIANADMGAFAYSFGRNDIGQLGVGSARPNRLPKIADGARHQGLDLHRIAAGTASVVGISSNDGKGTALGLSPSPSDCFTEDGDCLSIHRDIQD